MRIVIFIAAFSLAILFGCNKAVNKEDSKYSIATDGNGKMIRLNTVTGEICAVGETCDSDLSGLAIDETYIYKGNGKFEKPNYNGWSIKEIK